MPNKQLPSENIPRAIVENITSTVNGKTVNTNIQLGGQRYSPEHFYNNIVQLVDNVYYSTDKANFTFGTDIMYSHLNSLYGSEMNGRFYYRGMDAFNANTPYRYAREVAIGGNPALNQNVLNAGLYAQMQTKLAKGLEMIAGLRADYTTYMNKPNFNQTVFNELGLNTQNGLNSFILQPRIQFNWDINDKHTDYLRFGAGIFGSDINNYAMINNQLFDGTKVISIDVNDPALLPIANFPGYRKDPSSAPGEAYIAEKNLPKTSTINMNGKDARIPVVYKANISYNHFFTERLKAGITFFTTIARHNYMYTDRNMVDNPYFRLENEGGRGVYVPASTITDKGIMDWQQGRKTTNVGRVLELGSGGKVNQFAVVLDATWRYWKDGEITGSYTWNDSRITHPTTATWPIPPRWA